MKKIIKNLIAFLGIVFTILMGFFGLSGVYNSLMGTYDHGGDPTYFLTFGLICLAIASTVLFLSVKIYYHR